jgi:hypothetical protein
MVERIVFLTGRLAYPRALAMVESLGLPAGSWRVVDIGVKVAALMTQAIIANRLKRPLEADRVILPGRCRADLDALGDEFGARFELGPDELADLPLLFGRKAKAPDLTKTDIAIFAEIDRSADPHAGGHHHPRPRACGRGSRHHRHRLPARCAGSLGSKPRSPT